jgi:hypothetical protein
LGWSLAGRQEDQGGGSPGRKGERHYGTHAVWNEGCGITAGISCRPRPVSTSPSRTGGAVWTLRKPMAEACQLHAVVSWQSTRRSGLRRARRPWCLAQPGGRAGRGSVEGAWATAAEGRGRRPAGLVPAGPSSAGARPRQEGGCSRPGGWAAVAGQERGPSRRPWYARLKCRSGGRPRPPAQGSMG